MKVWGLLVAAIIGAGIMTDDANAQTPPAAKPLPAGSMQVQVTEIMDRNGFEKPMIAARALVPIGWKTQGGVAWARQASMCDEPVTFNWSATSVDGLSSVELFPTEAWAAGSNGPGNCRPGNFQDIRSYLSAYVQRRWPGAKLGEYKPRIDFLDVQGEYLKAKIAMVNNSGLGMRAWADAGELRYTHMQNGKEIEGIVQASAMFYGVQTQSAFGMIWSLNAGTSGTFSARAPKGKLDLKMTEALRKSIKPDMQWAKRMAEFQAKMAGIAVDNTRATASIIVAGGAALTAQTIAANNAAVARGYADPNARYPASNTSTSSNSSSSSDSSDRIQRESIEGIRGVETYDDPVYGGTVQLDATYDHAWRVNNSESYILTNDPNFNPGLYNVDAQQLKVTR
jgi:hypothetical protein